MSFDERDVIFCRMDYEKGDGNYEDYYDRRPEKERMDKILRRRPILGDERSHKFNPLVSSIAQSSFDFLHDIGSLCNGAVAPIPRGGTGEQFTQILDGLARLYGAVSFGVTQLTAADYYTHKGQPAEHYGEEIAPEYKYAIVFAVEMDMPLMNTAPYATETIATSKGYVDVALVGMILSYYIRSLGYDARNNIDGNYLFPLPPLAEKAGLGEMGLHGLLVTPEYGPRVRLGAVATNIPLIPHEKKPWGLRAFCQNCRRCENACVCKSINNQTQGNEHGFYDSTCLSMWQRYGSDCGVCVIACPFAHGLPQDLIADLKSKEARLTLCNYCAERFNKRAFNFDLPDWLQAAQPKKKDRATYDQKLD